MDTKKLMRENLLLYKGDAVSVLTVAKSSLRVYNVTKDVFVERWIDSKHFEPLPLNVEMVEDLGFKTNGVMELKIELDHCNIYIEETQNGWEVTIRTGMGYVILAKVNYHHELMNILTSLALK